MYLGREPLKNIDRISAINNQKLNQCYLLKAEMQQNLDNAIMEMIYTIKQKVAQMNVAIFATVFQIVFLEIFKLRI